MIWSNDETDPKKIPTVKIIGVSNKIGIEMDKIPKGTKLDSNAYIVLAKIVDNKKEENDSLKEIVASVVAYLRGYVQGIAYVNRVREDDR
jgi:hypothetical protein